MELPYEKGVARNSELYDATPSERAKQLLYYIQRTGYFYCDMHYSVRRQRYESYLLLYVIHGRLRIDSGGQEAAVRAGECAFLNCYQPHAYWADEPLEYIWIHFDGSNTEAFCDAVRAEHGMVLRGGNYLRRQMEEMLIQLREIGQIDEVSASRRLHDLLCSLLYAGHPNEVADPFIAAVQRYLNEHLAEDLSTALLAKQFHLSVSQLNRQFKAHTGQPLHEYLVNLRVNRAKTLLKETRLSMTEIAAQVGYAYDTSFAAAFRSKVGMSPRKFRAMPI